MELGKQIRKNREEIGISQNELAERIFVSRQTVSNWENDKNCPDVKSLVLLSALFGVSLDILIKGDIEEMKEITEENMKSFKRSGAIFTVLMLSLILSLVPLMKLGGYIGVGIWFLLAVITILYALRIERLKKAFDIQTYKEIVAFSEGKTLNEIEKNREYGKRPYQKFVLALGAGLLTIAVAVITYCILF